MNNRFPWIRVFSYTAAVLMEDHVLPRDRQSEDDGNREKVSRKVSLKIGSNKLSEFIKILSFCILNIQSKLNETKINRHVVYTSE